MLKSAVQIGALISFEAKLDENDQIKNKIQLFEEYEEIIKCRIYWLKWEEKGEK